MCIFFFRMSEIGPKSLTVFAVSTNSQLVNTDQILKEYFISKIRILP